MGCEIIREPFILLETTWMLYRYVNRISFLQDLHESKYLTLQSPHERTVRRMNRIQEMMEEICRDLDPSNPKLLRFFANQKVDTVEYGDTCLGVLMTWPFSTLKESGFWENIGEIKATWKNLQTQGARILPNSGNLLQFANPQEDSGDLFSQVRALNLPADFRLELYDSLRNFDKTIAELAELIEPLATRLEEAYRQEHWLLDELVDYWQETFRSVTPGAFWSRILNGAINYLPGAAEDGNWVIGISLMLSKNLVWHTSQDSLISPDYNYAYIGCNIDAGFQRGKRENRLEQISAVLKTLADKKRLEVLQRLSSGSSYCYELAEAMQVDYGNLSRTLSTLHSYGFLQQERELTRNYYRTDLEAIHEFFQLVESILGK